MNAGDVIHQVSFLSGLQPPFHLFFITSANRNKGRPDPDLVAFNIVDLVNRDDKGFVNPDE